MSAGVELKPCPFCGGAATVIRQFMWPQFEVRCATTESCPMAANGFKHYREDLAADEWNTRAESLQPLAPGVAITDAMVERAAIELCKQLRADVHYQDDDGDPLTDAYETYDPRGQVIWRNQARAILQSALSERLA